MVNREAARIELPVRDFLYTIDQIAMLFEVPEETVLNSYLFYQNRSVGVRPKGKMLARDISPDDEPKPDWRVPERELVRWMRYKGFRYHTRGYIQ